MALEFIARLLLGTLTVLRVNEEIGTAALWRAYLALQTCRRGHGSYSPTVVFHR